MRFVSGSLCSSDFLPGSGMSSGAKACFTDKARQCGALLYKYASVLSFVMAIAGILSGFLA